MGSPSRSSSGQPVVDAGALVAAMMAAEGPKLDRMIRVVKPYHFVEDGARRVYDSLSVADAKQWSTVKQCLTKDFGRTPLAA